MTANYIGTTLQKMSKSVQLIVVTHLPQIARCAAHHFTITKTVKANDTCVIIEQLKRRMFQLSFSEWLVAILWHL